MTFEEVYESAKEDIVNANKYLEENFDLIGYEDKDRFRLHIFKNMNSKRFSGPVGAYITRYYYELGSGHFAPYEEKMSLDYAFKQYKILRCSNKWIPSIPNTHFLSKLYFSEYVCYSDITEELRSRLSTLKKIDSKNFF